MKRTAALLIILMILGPLAGVKAQALKNGFSIKAQLGIPSASFGTIEDVDSEYAYSVTYGLQIGNQWYFNPKENYGFGLMINWIDGTWTQKTTDNTLGSLERASLDVSFLEIGPVGTLALSDIMAIDAYYNLRPTVISSAYRMNNSDSEGYGGFGFTHAFGAQFRFSLLVAGVEYVLGNAKVSQDSTDPEFFMDSKIKADCFRIFAGVKF